MAFPFASRRPAQANVAQAAVPNQPGNIWDQPASAPFNQMPGQGPFAAALGQPPAQLAGLPQAPQNDPQQGFGGGGFGGALMPMFQQPQQQFAFDTRPGDAFWQRQQNLDNLNNQSGISGLNQTIGNVLQGNANRATINRQNQWQFEAEMARTNAMLEMSRGRQSTLDNFLRQMGGSFGNSGIGVPQQPGLSDAQQIQDQSAGSLFDDLLSDVAPSALADNTIADPNINVGVNDAAGQVWGRQNAQDARSRLGAVVGATAPHIQGGNGGLQNAFTDLLRGASARTFSGLERAGTQADARHTLNAQMANAQSQNALRQLMTQIFAQNLGSQAQGNVLRTRMLGALA